MAQIINDSPHPLCELHAGLVRVVEWLRSIVLDDRVTYTVSMGQDQKESSLDYSPSRTQTLSILLPAGIPGRCLANISTDISHVVVNERHGPRSGKAKRGKGECLPTGK
jgi:hypothetical protein